MNAKPNFEEFYKQYRVRVLTYIKSRFNRSQEEAEELVNDSLLKAYKNFDNFDSAKGNLLQWICSVAFQVTTDHIRTDHRKHFANADDYVTPDGKFFLDYEADDTASHNVDAYETLSAIQSALQRLSDNNRKVAELRFIEEKSYKEIAKILEMPVNRVCQIVARSRASLQVMLQSFA